MLCPKCNRSTSLCLVRQKKGKKYIRVGYQRYCVNIDCEWDSGKIDFPPNDRDLRLNLANLNK